MITTETESADPATTLADSFQFLTEIISGDNQTDTTI